MKIVGLTMMTNPTYRQDPWRENIRQMLEVMDEVVVVCGAQNDLTLIQQFVDADSRVQFHYLEWPQPEWRYDELPKHLNFGLQKAKDLLADWVIKLDIDTFIHEKDKDKLREVLKRCMKYDAYAVSFEKYQFFMPNRSYEKGKMPLALNMHHNTVQYGYAGEYTDLCQPITPHSATSELFIQGKMQTFNIPNGTRIPDNQIQRSGMHVFNYDYTFKTEQRAKELLYHFDRSHAKFWGNGYNGQLIEDITPESALENYLNLVRGRIKKCVHRFSTEDHPKMIQPRIRNMGADSFGDNLWGLIEIPKNLAGTDGSTDW